MGGLKYLLLLILATAFYAAISFFYKADVTDAIFFISILWILPLSVRLGMSILEKETDTLKIELEGGERRRDEFSRKLADIKKDNACMEEKLTDLSKLYAITKEMSFAVRFDELLNSLKNFLEDNLQFGKFIVVLFRHKADQRSIERAYEISQTSTGYIELSPVLRDLANSIAKSEKTRFLEKNKNLFNFGFDPAVQNILAIPLIIQKKVISAFLVENITDESRDRFLILAPQVALQIERISLFDSVEKLSIMDGLTGTFLRRYFLERSGEEILRAEQCRTNLSFIMADLDYFKRCNDNFGHLVGDVVLREVAGILKENVRKIDLVARFGGEEFCILLPETNKTSAHIVAERIRKAVKNSTIRAYDETIQITISMGISSFPEDSNRWGRLLEKADKALYKAKKEGRDRVCLAS